MFLRKVCEKFTKHRFRRFIGKTEKEENDPIDYKPEYYWECKICGKIFWSYLDEIKEKHMSQINKQK
jgi:hypothetical protein